MREDPIAGPGGIAEGLGGFREHSCSVSSLRRRLLGDGWQGDGSLRNRLFWERVGEDLFVKLGGSRCRTVVHGCRRGRLRDRSVRITQCRRICGGLPRFGTLSSSVTSLSVRCKGGLLSKSADTISTLGGSLTRLHGHGVRLLGSTNFPRSCLRPICSYPSYGSAKCVNGRGYRYFGGTVVKLLCSRSGVGGFPMRASFDGFELSCCPISRCSGGAKHSSHSVVRSALHVYRRFVSDFKARFGGLFFCKSINIKGAFLSAYVTGRVVGERCSILCFSTPRLFGALTGGTFSGGSVSTRGVYRCVFSYSLLVVSSLNARCAGTFVTSRFFAYVGRELLREGSAVVSAGLSLRSLTSLCARHSFSEVADECDLLGVINSSVHVGGGLRR